MLEERILYDDDRVFDRLHINDNSADFIEACTTSVQHSCGNSIGTLKRVCEAAESRREDALEQEEREDTNRGANQGSREERLMYGPLSVLFSHITYFTYPGQKAHDDAHQRAFKMTNHLGKPDEPHTAGMPTASTDFMGIRHDADPNFPSWSDRDLFAEVKPSSKQGPKVSPGGIPRILVKCAEYACLFMDGRPFMLFCTGLLIFGTRFCVGMFDREGIILSPVHDMFNDLEVFVAVVRRLTHRASTIDLGLDPSVNVLSLATTRELTKEEGSTEFPSTLVPVGGPLEGLWCTIGPPIHVPQSLFGGGTHAWRVRRYDRRERELCGPVMVMKTTWRRGGRRTESDVYDYIMHIDPLIHGLAVFEMGGDVTFPDSVNVISISNLRRSFTSNNVPRAGATLHRLVLKSVGIPMWEYDSDNQLLKVFRDVVQAHELLCERGILHRDINPGNILLNIEQNTARQGILVDLDSASLFSSAAHTSPTQHIGDRHRQDFVLETENDVKSGLLKPVSRSLDQGKWQYMDLVGSWHFAQGTAQFMARELLLGMTDRHTIKHDIESFIWTFSYCVWRKILHTIRRVYATTKNDDDQKTLKLFQKDYDKCFSQTNQREIALLRHYFSPAITFIFMLEFKNIVETFMTSSLVNLFEAFSDMLYASESRHNPIHITHKILLDAVNKAISTSNV